VKKALLVKTVPIKLSKDGWEYKTLSFEVNVMAQSGNYFMVRRPGFIPFVAHKKELQPLSRQRDKERK
jgi:hypothetical protein